MTLTISTPQGSTIKQAHQSESMTWTISTPPGFFGYASTQQWKYDINHIHTSRVLRLRKYTTVKVWHKPYPHLQGSSVTQVHHSESMTWIISTPPGFFGYTSAPLWTGEMNHIHTSRVLRLHKCTTVNGWNEPYPHFQGSSVTQVHPCERVKWTISTPPGLYD